MVRKVRLRIAFLRYYRHDNLTYIFTTGITSLLIALLRYYRQAYVEHFRSWNKIEREHTRVLRELKDLQSQLRGLYHYLYYWL
jgi:hypothetical protein